MAAPRPFGGCPTKPTSGAAGGESGPRTSGNIPSTPTYCSFGLPAPSSAAVYDGTGCGSEIMGHHSGLEPTPVALQVPMFPEANGPSLRGRTGGQREQAWRSIDWERPTRVDRLRAVARTPTIIVTLR